MGIKSNLRILMAQHRIDGITDLMNRSGLSRNSINKLYRDNEEDIQTANLKTLIALCNVFNCKLSELIEYEPEKE